MRVCVCLLKFCRAGPARSAPKPRRIQSARNDQHSAGLVHRLRFPKGHGDLRHGKLPPLGGELRNEKAMSDGGKALQMSRSVSGVPRLSGLPRLTATCTVRKRLTAHLAPQKNEEWLPPPNVCQILVSSPDSFQVTCVIGGTWHGNRKMFFNLFLSCCTE